MQPSIIKCYKHKKYDQHKKYKHKKCQCHQCITCHLGYNNEMRCEQFYNNYCPKLC